MMLCGGFKCNFPAWEDKHCRVAPERAGKHLRSFNSEADSAVLDGGDGGLRDAREIGKLGLAQLLEFPQNADGFSDGYLNTHLGGAIVSHSSRCDG